MATVKKEIKLLDVPSDFTDATKNPYFDPNIGGTGAPKVRNSRRVLQFAKPGRYIEQADKERAQVCIIIKLSAFLDATRTPEKRNSRKC